MDKKSIVRDGFITFCLATLCMTAIFLLAGIFPGQKTVVLTGDLYYQYAPFSHLLAEKVRRCSNFYYSFEMGMGGNTALAFLFYAMSPLNIFYYFIDSLEIATVLVLILKPAVAAAFFCAYARYNLRQDSRLVIALSIGYGLSSFYFSTIWMNSIAEGTYFLPLVLIFLKYFLDTKKMAGLTLVYAASFISYFYGGYIVGLSSLMYLILCVFVHRSYTRKEKAEILLRYAACVITAVLIAAALLLPAGYYALFLNAEATVPSLYKQTPLWDIIACFLPGRKQVLSKPYPYLYCGILPLMLLVPYLKNREIEKKERYCVAASLLWLLLCVEIKPLYILLHMMNEPDGYTVRFAYVICFIVVSAAVRELSYLDRLRWRDVLATCITLILFFVAAPVLDILIQFGYYMKYSKKNLVMLFLAAVMLLWAIVILLCRKESRMRLTAILGIGLMMMETTFNGSVMLGGCDYGYTGDREIYEALDDAARNAINEIRERDSGVYRIYYLKKNNHNMQSLYGYRAVASFSSVSNKTTPGVMNSLGYGQGDFILDEDGQTEAVQMLFGVKYIVDHSLPQSGHVDYTVTENPYALPLGFMVRRDILEYEFTDNPLDNQQNLLECMTGEQKICMEHFSGNVALDTRNIIYEQSEAGIRFYCAGESEEVDYIKITIPRREGQNAYAMLHTDADRDYYFAPAARGVLEDDRFDAETRTIGMKPIVLMGDEGEECAVYILDPYRYMADYPLTLQKMQFAYCHPDVLEFYYINLASGGMQIRDFEDGHIVGRVTATEDKPVLFTSVPYDEGWHAYVDGSEQEIVPVLGGGFVGLVLEPGEYEIEMKFVAPWSVAGIWMTVFGLMILAAMVAADHKGKRSQALSEESKMAEQTVLSKRAE